MKNIIYILVALSALMLAVAVLSHLGVKVLGTMVNLTPNGFLSGASVLLLLGINLTLLELLEKK